ncbi:MAG: M14 family zinc carboxypeptidase, partial [Bacteroidales bacterium]|nr:M14 family zinc carboxypeptidase [Bacteroidales bacterium]
MSKAIKTTLIIGLAMIQSLAWSQISLDYKANKTPEWHEVIEMYSILGENYKNASLIEIGSTDAGKPLHLFIISNSEVFSADELHQADKCIIMINNGIHPGESNGIDASLDFAADLLSGKLQLDAYLENTLIVIVPNFNVGGALNRSAYNRANQNGPEEHGFRGNARNLDLNRDFVKMDSRNSLSLTKIIHKWDPDVFIDTHSTNGADYPYTVTLIPSHHQQLENAQSLFMQNVMEPFLFSTMNKSPYKMCHYVNVFRDSPDQGFEGFYDYPRYLAGYTSTFHILSFTVETHMQK